MSIFAERVAAALEAEAPALTERWQTQARAVAPRAGARRASDVIPSDVAKETIGALVCALRRSPRCQDDVLRAGWGFGSREHARGTSLHHMVKEIDLLEAMVLYAAERIAARDVGASSSGVDVMGAARRLHRTFAAMRLAATKGFTHALVEVLRGRYRTLRHDLRNPIGTIRSAIALMDDESLPADIRFGERYRAMVTRNAASLETMITAALGDAQAHGPALTLQDVSLAELARTVRRDLRDDAEAVGCTIELAPTLSAAPLPAVRVDSTAFELVLRSLVDAALDGARRGTVVTVGLRALRDEAASVAVSYVPAARAADHVAPPGELAAPDVSALAVELSRRAGGRVWREDDATLLLEIPVELRVGENATAAVGAAPQPAVADVPTVEGTDSFVAHEMDDAPSRNADQLPRGGGPPGDEVASPR